MILVGFLVCLFLLGRLFGNAMFAAVLPTSCVITLGKSLKAILGLLAKQKKLQNSIKTKIILRTPTP